MLNKEMMKSDIERELTGKGDYVQIDMIRRFLKENLSNDIRRFASMKLAFIYENRSMHADAAILYNKLAEIALNYADRMTCYSKQAENYIKAGYFEGADMAINKIMGEVKPMEKTKFSEAVKGFYLAQAHIYEKERRRSKAVEVYEKMLLIKTLLETEKIEIKNKLSQLYKELGLVQKYLSLQEKPKSK